MSVSTDRWSCPRCPEGRGTVVVIGSEADTRAAIAACQLRHAAEHRHAAGVLAKLGLPEAKVRGKRGRAA